MGRLEQLLRATRESGGSDLHLVSGIAPRVRRHGSLVALAGEEALTATALADVLREGVSASQWQEFEATGDLDFALPVPGVARFRGNFLKQERGPSAVFRTIPETIASLEELALPPVLGRLADLQGGLVLVTGPTGSGKSTTLAAIIDRINRTQARRSRSRSSSSTATRPRSSPSARSGPTPRASPPPSAPRCARTPTSSWSARCATSRRSRWRSRRPRWARWSSGRSTPTPRRRRSTG
jgi:hypothetical protein